MTYQARRAGQTEQTLCRLDEIPDRGGLGLTLDAADGPRELFLVRAGDAVYGYVNSCPHVGTPLDWVPNQFIDPSGGFIMCATHGARFRIEDGHCVAGPCRGARLTVVPISVRDGAVHLAAG
ncbi:MAG: Rieske (2Fe-2S) protein [Alphaproteobacteria bacterium]